MEWDLKRRDSECDYESSNALLTCGKTWKQANHPCVHDSVTSQTALVLQRTLRAVKPMIFTRLWVHYKTEWGNTKWRGDICLDKHKDIDMNTRRPILACTDPHWPQMGSIIPDVGGCQDRWTAICSEEHTGTQRASLFSSFKSGIRDCLHMDISVWRAVFLPSGWLISRVSLHLVAEPNIKHCLPELLSLTCPHKET